MARVNDPLEALRVTKPEAAPVKSGAAPKVEEKPAKVEPPPVVPPPLPPAYTATYRVTAEKQITLRGQIIKLKPGKLFSEATHGMGIIEHLQKAGVALEKVG